MPNPFSLRMSDELRNLMELSAKEAKVTLASLIVRACWQYLERGGGTVDAIHSDRTEMSMKIRILPPQPNTNFEDRKAIAMKAMSDALMKENYPNFALPVMDNTAAEVMPKNRCTNRDHNAAGDWFRCIHQNGHKGSHLPSAFAEEY